MSNIHPLDLDPDRAPWERQPKETVERHNQFCVYRDAGRTRTLRKAAESLTKNERYLRDVAAACKWRDRAEAWDRHLDELYKAEWLEERRKVAKSDAALLREVIGRIRHRLPDLISEHMSASDMVRLLDVALRHRRALFGDPAATIAVTGPGGDPVAVQLAEFAGLTSEQRRDKIADLMSAVTRRVAAVDGSDDDG